MEDDTSVRVAVRIRPQIPRELIDMCRICTSVSTEEPQVWLGNDKAFTFDYVFDIPAFQQQIYETCVQQLIEGCFEGYNATVLAYGQTGSGKTYTMGTGFDVNVVDLDELGIIPRAVDHLFEGIEERRQRAYDNNEPLPDFKIHCQFMELYNEEIIDLFDTTRDAFSKGKKSSNIRIHEDSSGGIYTVGVTTRIVTSKAETLQCLKIGALSRTTASTQMNVASSRSHAIFTLHIKQQRVAKVKDPDTELDTTDVLHEYETLTAKFHFVDLAGSERLKRTGATGERAKEGISINCGLLALGNVISALGDATKKGSHVPYRDSKLTRLLQDSLGGNSRTVMIACISPSDRDFMETLNTLKYANRARNIRNKVVANQDKTSKQLSSLRMEIQQLQLELMEYKQGKRVIVDGEESINDMYHENTMLQTENNNLRVRIKAMQETIETLTAKNTELLASKAAGEWIAAGGDTSDMSKMVQGYITEVEELRIKLLESEHMCQTMRKSVSRTQTRLSMSPLHNQAIAFSGQYDIGCDVETSSVNNLLEEARRDLERMKYAKRRARKSAEPRSDSDEDGAVEKEEELEDSDEHNEDNNDDEEETSESDIEAVDEQYRSDLADLTCEISIKQKLIDELEKSQRRLQTMRHSYEEKLVQLQNKIKATQDERDKVLSSLGNIEHNSQEKTLKVRSEYEKKLNDLSGELKKIQSAKKEHARLLKNQTMYEKQMKTLRSELGDMKKAKVRLMTKIKEEANRHKESEQRRNREIAQLRKESRVKENKIRTIEAENKLKDTVLKRKQEEVSALRRLAKPMSDKVAGRVPGSRERYNMQAASRMPHFSPKIAKSKWQHLEKDITKLVLNKKAIATWEKEMENKLQEREALSHKLEKYMKKRDAAIRDRKDPSTIRDLDDQIDTLRDTIDYVQESIADCQTNIMQTEGAKEGQENADVNALVNDLGVEEAKYMLEKMLTMTVSQSLLAAQREANLKEMEAKMMQAVQSSSLHQELLEHMLQQQDMAMYNFYLNGNDDGSGSSTTSSRSISPIDSAAMHMQASGGAVGNQSSSLNTGDKGGGSKIKARRRTAANPMELLYGGSEDQEGIMSVRPFMDIQEDATDDQCLDANKDMLSYSTSLSVVSNASTSGQQLRPTTARLSPQLQRKTYVFPTTSSALSNSVQHNNNDICSEQTPPVSPTPSRKGVLRLEENVFSRLTSSSTSSESSQPDRGVIKALPATKPSGRGAAMLTCVHVAQGHSKAVLSVVATDDLMFTASKDRTVKVWDLHRGEEILSLDGHPNNVLAVRYCDRTKQIFTASSAFIKVWDLRGSSSKCIKTLSSSGLATNGTLTNTTSSRTLKLPQGEHQINDFVLDRYGTTLYSAANNIVRIWDLRKYQSIGKLSGGHQAAVMCLAVDDNVIVTGSKDHYIKVFEVGAMCGGTYPAKKSLEPPHYDGIQSLALVGNLLFSGSRDMCIKKWNLQSDKLELSQNQAHKDWVTGLCVTPGGKDILSCCRGGYVRQWSINSFSRLGEVKAHDRPIYAITKNNNCIFTASDDNTVRMWKLKSTSNDITDVRGTR